LMFIRTLHVSPQADKVKSVSEYNLTVSQA
jgi:hypothetical protein